jgi:cell division protein FtsW
MSIIKLKGDKIIWIIVLLLALISVVAVFSSSTYLANEAHVNKTVIFLEQIRSVLIGFLALFICYLIPLGFYRTLAYTAFGISIVMLILLYVPGFQDIKNGAVRGIKIGGRTIQVFEFAKVGLILYLAKTIEKLKDITSFKVFAKWLLFPIALVCGLVMVNSFSSAVLFGLISFLLLFLVEVKFKYLAIAIGSVVAVVLLLFGIYNMIYDDSKSTSIEKENKESGIAENFFRRFGTVQSRLLEFKEEIKDNQGSTTKELTKADIDEMRQSENAKIAISGGKLFGKGPGKSTQRHSLSMAFSDFIYAFIIEEYGLFGGIIVILLYLMFLFRCIRISKRCTELFSGSLVLGLAFLISTQAFLHILVNVRLMPITGHTLPLISHGGTAYLVLCGAFGMILSVSKKLDFQDKQREITEEKEKVAPEKDI